ncbi:hypothetical protein FE257_005941 [Aspergillus nanangensis]|uniref:Uncharacterized protein n=1 Tax=Aspergillus nanangensis TaxID=2582783 RepID=A0AAD4CPZ3_ASPNN|nr:hypothetical protein FE257_005941 [Aspergillus nanangensis]
MIARHYPIVEWTLSHVVYGIHLGDLTHLSAAENEFLVATCVVTTGGPRSPSVTHLNALLRVGVTGAHVEAFETIRNRLFTWAGLDPGSMVTVKLQISLFLGWFHQGMTLGKNLLGYPPSNSKPDLLVTFVDDHAHLPDFHGQLSPGTTAEAKRHSKRRIVPGSLFSHVRRTT